LIVANLDLPQYGCGESGIFHRNGSNTIVIGIDCQVVVIRGYGNNVTVLYLRKGAADQREQGAEGEEYMFFHLLRV
jgi:hypothetical protein